MTQKEINELRARVYSISNSMFPLDAFFNDIEQVKNQNYNKEGAYNDLKLITDAIYELKEKLKEKEQVYTLEEIKKEWEYLGYEWVENIYENSIGLRKVVKEEFFVIAGEHEVNYLIIINFIDKTYSAEKRSCFTAEGIELTLQEHQLLTKTFKALGWYDV